MTDSRLAAVRAVQRVVAKGQSLDRALAEVPGVDALARELTYGVLRWQPRLAAIVALLLERPLRARDADVQALLMVGLYQLRELRVPDHAAVHATVGVAGALGKPWAKGLANGVLRSYLRGADEIERRLESDQPARWAHPQWLIERVRRDWPQDWQRVLEAGNQRPPMTLRVNVRRIERQAYLRELEAAGLQAAADPTAAQAVTLASPCEVGALPGFGQGLVSVQDAAAQQAARLLSPRPGDRVLDACAAPGGKTAHLLELAPDGCEVTAVDIDAERLARVRETLRRLDLRAALSQGDASDPAAWWDGRAYDRVLLDAPCSATGVIRRHPDIKLLRRPEDVDDLVIRQGRMLTALWPLLKPGGILLYATCSILRAENHEQLRLFLASHPDAALTAPPLQCSRSESLGCQMLTGDRGMDGFFYAPITRTSD